MNVLCHVSSAAALLFSTAALAVDAPDFNFGEWETTTTTSMESAQFNMPDTTTSSVDCVTEEDFDEGRAFIQDMEDCSVISEDIRSDGADYSMVCSQEEMGEMTLSMSMKYEGDSMSGIITSEMDGPMGPMTMRIELSGERLGNCE